MGGRDIIFSACTSDCPPLPCPSVNTYSACQDISLFSGGISMKLVTNIHHTNGHCWKKNFQSHRSNVTVMTRFYPMTAEAYISTAVKWHPGSLVLIYHHVIFGCTIDPRYPFTCMALSTVMLNLPAIVWCSRPSGRVLAWRRGPWWVLYHFILDIYCSFGSHTWYSLFCRALYCIAMRVVHCNLAGPEAYTTFTASYAFHSPTAVSVPTRRESGLCMYGRFILTQTFRTVRRNASFPIFQNIHSTRNPSADEKPESDFYLRRVVYTYYKIQKLRFGLSGSLQKFHHDKIRLAVEVVNNTE